MPIEPCRWQTTGFDRHLVQMHLSKKCILCRWKTLTPWLHLIGKKNPWPSNASFFDNWLVPKTIRIMSLENPEQKDIYTHLFESWNPRTEMSGGGWISRGDGKFRETRLSSELLHTNKCSTARICKKCLGIPKRSYQFDFENTFLWVKDETIHN